MDLTNFSLLYPDFESQKAHLAGNFVPNIDSFELDELGLLEIFDLKNRELCEFVTSDPEVMAYRNETFSDMLDNPEIARTMNKLIPILNDIMELRRIDYDNGEASTYLSSITEIELYISSIETLHAGLSATRESIKGRALSTLADYVANLVDSDYYRQLNDKLKELTNRVREIKSVTIGVNLNAGMVPASAGVISVNAEPFKSGKLLDKILRLSFRNDANTCIADLSFTGFPEVEPPIKNENELPTVLF